MSYSCDGLFVEFEVYCVVNGQVIAGPVYFSDVVVILFPDVQDVICVSFGSFLQHSILVIATMYLYVGSIHPALVFDRYGLLSCALSLLSFVVLG